MRSLRIFDALFITLIGVSCVSNPRRPDAPLCGPNGDCRDSRGEYQEDPRLFLCTTPRGYSELESYIDNLELRIKTLERRCGIKE